MVDEPETRELHDMRADGAAAGIRDESVLQRQALLENLPCASTETSHSGEIADKNTLTKLSAGFFFLGLLNNVLYVIILSAALDLVPVDVPKGVVLFANIFPALVVKIGWPYLVPGRVRYGRRVTGCSLISFSGILLVAFSDSLHARLAGIAAASFSSGLGEMTYLQRSTCYGDDGIAKLAVGWFASGTGAAGLVGAALWWELRNLGVRFGLGVSSILPICMGLVWSFLIPASGCMRGQPAGYIPINSADSYHITQAEDAADCNTPPLAQAACGTSVSKSHLSALDKLSLARPLALPYMLPLFVVYFAEYTVNTGVSPNLLYPVPDRAQNTILGHVITKLSDYYPLWQLIYQTFVFFSRSSMVIFRIPPLPRKAISLPSIAQFFVLLLAITEATRAIFTATFGSTYAVLACLCLIAAEGLCGGLAYVNMYYRVGLIADESEVEMDKKDILARREFRIACVGFADTLGILVASLVSYWLEPRLCSCTFDSGIDNIRLAEAYVALQIKCRWEERSAKK